MRLTQRHDAEPEHRGQSLSQYARGENAHISGKHSSKRLEAHRPVLGGARAAHIGTQVQHHLWFGEDQFSGGCGAFGHCVILSSGSGADSQRVTTVVRRLR